MTPLVEILSDLGIPYLDGTGHQHARPGWIQFDCPFCDAGSRRYHMGYRIEGGYVHCWRCGRQDLYRTLQALGVRDLRESLARLRQTAPGFTRAPLPARRSHLSLPLGIGPLRRPHRDYLRRRGLNPRQISHLWGGRGIGIAGRLSWRIYLPITQDGRLVSWTTRTIGDSEPRYLTCPAGDEIVAHQEILYGEDLAQQSIIVVEGPFDALRIGPGAVACLGLSFSHAQIERIARYPVRAICFDNEPEAQRRARKLAETLSVLPGETHLVTLDAKDPGSASRREIRQLRRAFL